MSSSQLEVISLPPPPSKGTLQCLEAFSVLKWGGGNAHRERG